MSDEEKQTSNDSEAQEAAATESSAAAKAEEAKASALQAVTGVISTLKDLHSESPKVFYGAVGGVVLLLIILSMIGGGSDMNQTVKQTVQGLQIGQQYTLKSANAYDPNATVRLVGTPGNMAAYDDTDKADREGCKHLPTGTRVIVKDFYAAYGNPKAFAKVSPVSGECKDTIGWTSSNNVH